MGQAARLHGRSSSRGPRPHAHARRHASGAPTDRPRFLRRALCRRLHRCGAPPHRADRSRLLERHATSRHARSTVHGRTRLDRASRRHATPRRVRCGRARQRSLHQSGLDAGRGRRVARTDLHARERHRRRVALGPTRRRCRRTLRRRASRNAQGVHARPRGGGRGLLGAAGARDRRHPEDGVLRLFPDRVGLHQMGQGA